ncbi:TPA: biopolymer transporter ExbB [Enterobacter asburiae]|nr:biopolymer transporter ExbB [Enterobacter asburiae]
MKKQHRIAPAIILFLLPFPFIVGGYYLFRYMLPGTAFNEHRDVLGAAIATYSGTTIAILIAALTFMMGIGGRNIYKLKAYGYMTSVITLYALTFVELGIIFFNGIFLLATSKTPIPMLPSFAIGLSAASLVHIGMLLIQIFNFSKSK